MIFSGKWTWVVMYVAMFFVLVRAMKPKTLVITAIALALAITFADQTCATIIRPLVHRMRPSNPENELSQFVTLVNGYRSGRYGFPSCHAANTFALAVFFSNIVRKRLFVVLIFLWAVINCYSRMYLGVHYPGDIIVGATIGSIYGYIFYLAAKKLSGHSHDYGMAKMRTPLLSFSTGYASVPRIIFTVGDILLFTIAATLIYGIFLSI